MSLLNLYHLTPISLDLVLQISSCDIFAGCEGVEALPCAWRDADGQLEKLVVFGYGSVIWKPGIEFEGE